MPCKDLMELAPAVTAACGGTSELRYRLLMAALGSCAESVPSSQLGAANAAPAKPASRRGKPKRSHA